MSDQPITSYCVKCRTQREMASPQATYTSKGGPGTRGQCAVCGTGMFKMGLTPAHQGVPRPDPVAGKPVAGKPVAGKPVAGKPPTDKPAAKRRATPRKEGTSGKGKRRSGAGRDLVIVESPAKARTIGRFLGAKYAVKASVGHVRDLPSSRLGVDVENGFAPKYLVPKKARKVVKDLLEASKDAPTVYLATDPDREGEAIAWHLAEALKLTEDRYRRVVFHEITKDAVAEGFAHARGMDMDLIDAQQARRVLDRLVGYKISPLLWRNVRGRLSAGRVQSVALRLVVEREREILAFVPVEFWTIEADLAKRFPPRPREQFRAKLARIDGNEPDLKCQADAQAVVDDLEGATYLVNGIKKGTRQRRPPAPFTTSTMQQDAGSRLGYTASRTVTNAQRLYEGVDAGEGLVGLITYMRTDSVNVAAEAQAEAREYIAKEHGAAYLPETPPTYKTRAKKAQEAHEAIRPTSVLRTPDAMKPFLEPDQHRLYELIWRRFLASQMNPALYDTTSAEIVAGHPAAPLTLAPSELLPAKVLREMTARWRYLFRASGSILRFPGFLAIYGAEKEEDEDRRVPELTAGEWLDLIKLLPEQRFTQPPPRFSEASLVKALEELGIGRPSTYAPTISTLQTRGYVERQGRSLHPAEIGFTVNDLLVEHFPVVLDYGFTAKMEDDLDRIADGDAQWVGVLDAFYGPFAEALAVAEVKMPKVELVEEDPGIDCPACGNKMVIKYGRFGKFIACSNYPACKETMPFVIKTGANCPKCGGELVQRKSRRGRTFYGCSNYPSCEFATWNRPVAESCPACGGLVTDRGKKGLVCEKCGQTVAAPEKEPA